MAFRIFFSGEVLCQGAPFAFEQGFGIMVVQCIYPTLIFNIVFFLDGFLQSKICSVNFGFYILMIDAHIMTGIGQVILQNIIVPAIIINPFGAFNSNSVNVVKKLSPKHVLEIKVGFQNQKHRFKQRIHAGLVRGMVWYCLLDVLFYPLLGFDVGISHHRID